MNIVLIYATNSSGTLAASEIIGDVFRKQGHTVTLADARATDPTTLNAFDLIILGSCTWERRTDAGKVMEGQLQEHMRAFADRARELHFPGKRFAVFGLGDETYTHFCGAVDHLEFLVKKVGGTLIGTSLKLDRFLLDIKKNKPLVLTWARSIAKATA